MQASFKDRLFKFVYWIMLIIIAGDTLDTIYRFVFIGYLGEGATFPGVECGTFQSRFGKCRFLEEKGGWVSKIPIKLQ